MISITDILTYLKILAPAWATTTGYTAGENYVTQSSVIYICAISHTSGTFATDLAAGKWRISELYNCINHGIDFVEGYTNTHWDATAISITEYFNPETTTDTFLAHNYPVTEVTTIKKFDEDTSTWITIFEGSDTIADSVLITGVDFAIILYNGYSFSAGTRYQIVYKYISVILETIKTVAKEQAARKYFNSGEGETWFGLTAKNVGSQATSSYNFESEDDMNKRHYGILDYWRIPNV